MTAAHVQAVREAIADAHTEEKEERQKAGWHPSQTWENERLRNAKEAADRAARLAEVAAHLQGLVR